MKKAKKKQTQFIIAIRVADKEFNGFRNEIFQFRSRRARDCMAKVCDEYSINYAVTEKQEMIK